MNKIYLTFLLLFAFTFNLKAQNVALDFDGIDDYVQSNFTGVSGNGARTVEAWIKTTKDSQPTASGQSVIADWGTFVNGGRFTFNILWGNAIRLEVGGSGLSASTPVNDGNWHHVAVTYDPTSSPSVNLYVDGVRDASGNLTVSTGVGNNMQIGKRIDNSNLFEGGIDEVRVYDFEKDSTSIYNDMNLELCGALPSGLVSYFKFNEGIPNGANTSNSLATDYVPNNTNAMLGFGLTGTTSNWTDGAGLSGGAVYDTLYIAGCSSFSSPSGNATWTESGIYTDTFQTVNGCDSIVVVDLTVFNSNDTITAVECGSFMAPSGAVFTSSGTYYDTLVGGGVLGCDIRYTLYLTITNGTVTVIDTAACDSLSYNGTMYTASTSFSDTFTLSPGCDSVVTTNIGINNSITTMDTVLFCDSVEIDGVWYSTEQDLTFVGTTNSFPTCDSTHVLTLAKEYFDFSSATLTDWDVFLPTLPNTYYEWFLSADSSFFQSDSVGHLDGSLGDFGTFYYVVVTTPSCSFTEEYYIIGEPILEIYQSDFKISPNPNVGSFVVDLGVANNASSYKILDVIGREVVRNTADNTSLFTVQEELPAGMYTIIIETNNGLFANRFMVK